MSSNTNHFSLIRCHHRCCYIALDKQRLSEFNATFFFHGSIPKREIWLAMDNISKKSVQLLILGLLLQTVISSNVTAAQNVTNLNSQGSSNITRDTELKGGNITLQAGFKDRRLAPNGTSVEAELVNLIEFLFNGTTGRNVYFFYDSADAVISASIAMCYRRGAEVTVFRCLDGVDYVDKIIMSFNKLESIRNVFVLCSPKVTKSLFNKIYKLFLESALTHWFVILYEDILKELLPIMREGTQVTFSINREPGLYDLRESYINIKNKAATRELGWWFWNATIGTKKLLMRPLYRPVLEVYKDFGGRELIVTVIDNWPFWHLTYPGDGRVIPTSGLDYNVLKTIGDHLNFTLRMEITPDGKWGGVMADGNVTGMVGVVHRHEAHAAINEFTITEQRERAVDFTKPYYYECTTLISPAPTKQIRMFAVLMSFTPKVWTAFLILMIIIPPLVMLLVRLRRKLFGEINRPWERLATVYFMMFGHLMIQATRIPSDILVYRLFFVFWFLFCFLVTALYSEVMISMLAVPAFEKPIDSLYDLLEAIEKRHFITCLGCGSNNEFIYSNTDQKIYRDIYARFDHSKGCVKNWDDGMDKVLSGGYVFSNNRLGAEVRANLRGRSKFHFAEHEFYAHGYSIACPNGSPYKTAFEEVLIRELSHGLVQKFTKDELDKARKPEDVGDNGPEPINIQHLQAAFFLVAIGNACALLLLVVEKLAHWKKSRSTKRSTGNSDKR
ncbi:glutamate receptor ionotropic, kainate 5-like isoform X2 [Macrobrachium nipponense]|uniref:glutamate receptor ionotropic, kainate 5-like isoform X2 n=1 Tax=Macrobrachium nipponense TaxID=159736 RepID=UPI0030C89D58